ncbi:MAG: hypothetical protein DDT19_00771 [Syntrophomonadaceae bacterium]|nr:hypothetical protein [Bacillota bacterium]
MLETKPARAEKKARQLPIEEKIKEAWEMTRDEFIENRLKTKFFTDQIEQKIMTKEQIIKVSESRHQNEVRAAIDLDKTIPPEVLKDYPDLQKQVQKSPTALPDKERLKIPICYVCGKKATKEKMQYVGQDKWRCKKCFAGSKSWLKSDVSKKSILNKFFKSTMEKGVKKG